MPGTDVEHCEGSSWRDFIESVVDFIETRWRQHPRRRCSVSKVQSSGELRVTEENLG